MRMEPDPQLSLMRPAWTSENLNAYRNLYLQKQIVKDHFVRTRGFRTVEDYNYARRRR